MVMQKMRAGAQGLAAKLLMGVIVLVLAVTGFGAIQLFSASEPVAASVNGEDVTERALEGEVRAQRQYYKDVAENITEETLNSLVTPAAVLSVMVDTTLLRQAATDLGLSMSDETVRERFERQLAGTEGFDDALFRNYLASTGQTPTSFHAARLGTEITEQLRRGLRDTAFMTERELRRSTTVVAQGRDIAWLTFKVLHLMAESEITDEAVEEHYDLYKSNYLTEERFDFEFVRLPRDTLLADVKVDEDAVLAAYEAEVENAEPLRHAAHILLEVTEERSAEDAMRQLAEVREALDAGADFAEKARELSEDPGTAESGGDLGPSTRGVFPAPFEDVLWALSPGETSAPVETEFGVHLIHLVDVAAPEIPPFDERREAIATRLASDEADQLFQSALREMDELAFESEDSLDALAQAYDLEIERLDGVTRNVPDGLLADAAVRDAVFADEVLLEGYNTSAVATADAHAVVARLRMRHPPEQRPLDEVRESVRLTLAHAAARQVSEARALEALEAFAQGTAPADIAAQHGLEWERADNFRRDGEGVPPAVADLAFQMRAPAPGAREADVARLADDSRALVLLSNVVLADYETISESDLANFTGAFESDSAARDFAAVLATLHADASIHTTDLTNDG